MNFPKHRGYSADRMSTAFTSIALIMGVIAVVMLIALISISRARSRTQRSKKLRKFARLRCIRWSTNDPTAKSSAGVGRTFWLFLLSAIVTYIAGLCTSFVALAAVGAGQGALIILFEFFILPPTLLLVSFLFVPVTRISVSSGFFGLSQSMIISIVLIGLISELFLLNETVGFGEASILGVNYAVTYGAILGTVFWFLLAGRNPASFFKTDGADMVDNPPTVYDGFLITVLLVFAWQIGFWLLSLYFSG